MKIYARAALQFLPGLLALSGALHANVDSSVPRPVGLQSAPLSLSIADRMDCAMTIETFRWENSVWPSSDVPKPSLAKVFSIGDLKWKVEDGLKQEAILAKRFSQPIDAAVLQAELDRVVAETREPEKLAEIYRRLGSDANRFAECLLRPDLVRRHLFEAYTQETIKKRLLRSDSTESIADKASGRKDAEETFDSWWIAQRSSVEAVSRNVGERLFAPEIHNAGMGGIAGKAQLNNSWTTTSGLGAPVPGIIPKVIWTGNEMIVLSGNTATSFVSVNGVNGAKYSPLTNSWLPVADMTGAYWNRFGVAVWSGTEVILWGGKASLSSYSNFGGRYNPATNSWTAIPAGGLTPREEPSAVWNGSGMIVWGGDDIIGAGGYRNDGAIFVPGTGWTALSMSGSPPNGRAEHRAVWTGSKMVIFGGFRTPLPIIQWGSYDNGVWTSSQSNSVLQYRHSAVWSGSEVLVFSGSNAFSETRQFIASPAPVRYDHNAVWTGHEWVIWGGTDDSVCHRSGVRIDPLTLGVSSVEVVGSPGCDGNRAIWTGSEMLVWGGSAGGINSVYHWTNRNTLTYGAGVGGSLSGSTIQTPNYGEDGAPVTATAMTGYHFVSWSDGSTVNPRVDIRVTGDISVTAQFSINQYDVAAASAGNGSITPGMQSVTHGAAANFAVIPAFGHHVVSVLGDTCAPSNIGNGNWRALNIQAPCTVTASFAINQYVLTYSAASNGSIAGMTPQTVDHGSDGSAVTAVANANHHFVQWSDNSTNNPRTDTTVTSNISVTAIFAIDQYTVTAASGGNGSITPSSQLVNHGGAVSFSVSPAVGYHVVTIVGDTCVPTDAGGGSWSATTIVSPCAVSASFAINEYALEYSAGANGSLGGALSQTVTHGGSGSEVTAIPAANHHFVQWSDGSTANPRTDANVTGSINVTAQFAIDTFSLSYAAASNGSIVGAVAQTVDYGGNGSAVTATPAAGYHFLQWSDASTANPRTDTGVTGNIAVTASFGNDAPSISLVSGTPTILFEAEASTIAVSASDLEGLALTYAFDCNNNGSYEIGPQVTASAACMFAAPGSSTVGVRVADGPGLSVTSSVDITVNNSVPTVTLNPTATPLEDVSVPLNALASVPSSGESITLVEADCDYDGATFTADQSNVSASLLSCQGYPNGGGRVIAVRATDSEPELSQIATAMVTVTAVNDRPSLTLGTIATHLAASNGQRSVPAFATVDLGPSDEDATQSVDDFLIDSITDADGVLVPTTLDIANNGTLAYELTGVGGIATVVVRVRDDGGVANGGENTSAAVQFTINVTPGADLELAKDNQRAGLLDGEFTVYAIVVANAGPNAVVGARISDPLPNTLINGNWTCVPAASTATCPTPGANPGNLDAYIDLGVNQYLRFDVIAEVDGNVGAFVTNTASVVVPNGTTAINSGNDSATDQDPILPLGVFSNGFEIAPTRVLTVPGATQAMDAN